MVLPQILCGGHGHQKYVVGCRVDTLASYGQLVGPPSYDDSILFERGDSPREAGSAASGGGRPALKISVTDPVKKVCSQSLPHLLSLYASCNACKSLWTSQLPTLVFDSVHFGCVLV